VRQRVRLPTTVPHEIARTYGLAFEEGASATLLTAWGVAVPVAGLAGALAAFETGAWAAPLGALAVRVALPLAAGLPALRETALAEDFFGPLALVVALLPGRVVCLADRLGRAGGTRRVAASAPLGSTPSGTSSA
jgi:hypothetical protein